MEQKPLICIAGKNNIAVDVLSYLINNCNHRYDLCIVCNKTETGENTFQKSLRFYANQQNIHEYHLEDLYEKSNLIFLSMEFDRIVKPSLFKTTKLYNIHFSLLPKYKGVYTSAMPLLFDEKISGVTFHKIDTGIDTGEIIDQLSFTIDQNDTSRDLYFKYIESGTALVLRNIENVISNQITSFPQPSLGSSYFSKKSIDYKNLTVDLNQTARGIQNQVRAYSFREYQLPKVYDKNIIASTITGIPSKEKCGTILLETPNCMMIATVDYNLILYYDRLDELLSLCKKGNINEISKICTVPGHINSSNKYGWTPLIVATYYNQIDVVKYLITRGADIYAKNTNGTNLLMYSKDAYLKTKDKTLFNLFYKLGLSIYEKDYSGKDLLYYLQENGLSLSELMSSC